MYSRSLVLYIPSSQFPLAGAQSRVFAMALPFCPAALKQVHNLDKSSPDFPDQLNNVLRGEEYREIRQGREADEMRWLVNYLDQVCHLVAFSHPLLKPA